MSSEASNEMLTLLKELSVYEAMDRDYRAGVKGRVEAAAHAERERRREEITQEMHKLADETKNSSS